MNTTQTRTAALIVAGVAALSLAACNRPAEETASTGSAIDATPTPASDSAMSGGMAPAGAPSSGAMAPSGGAMALSNGAMSASRGTTASSEKMSSSSGQGAMSPPASTIPNTQQTVAATKPTLSPAGASSGATAPAPAH